MHPHLSGGEWLGAAAAAVAGALDVASTQVGVRDLGNGEAGPFARLMMYVWGSSWWALYLPYEVAALLLAYFLVREVRSRAFRSTGSSLLRMPLEYFVPSVTMVTVVNNLLLILLRVPR